MFLTNFLTKVNFFPIFSGFAAPSHYHTGLRNTGTPVPWTETFFLLGNASRPVWALAPISSSGHVICRHDISLQNRMGAITRRRQMERAGRNKHPDGSCWNSELFLMYGPITQPFLFSLTLCNYFLRLGTQITRKLTDLSLNNHNGQLRGRSKGEILYNTINIQVWEPVRTQHPPRWHCESDHPAQGRHGAHIYLLFLIVCFTF